MKFGTDFFFTAVDGFPISVMRGYHLDLSGDVTIKSCKGFTIVE